MRSSDVSLQLQLRVRNTIRDTFSNAIVIVIVLADSIAIAISVVIVVADAITIAIAIVIVIADAIAIAIAIVTVIADAIVIVISIFIINIRAMKGSWHPDCFCCSICAKNLADEGFVRLAGSPVCR